MRTSSWVMILALIIITMGYYSGLGDKFLNQQAFNKCAIKCAREATNYNLTNWGFEGQSGEFVRKHGCYCYGMCKK